MFGHKAAKVVVPVDVSGTSATTSYIAYPPAGDTYTLTNAEYDDAAGITNGTPGDNYYVINLHQVSGAAHATVVDDGTGRSWSNASHTAYTPESIGLSTTAANLAFADGEGVEVVCTKAGSASNLPAGGTVYLTFVQGEGAGQA